MDKEKNNTEPQVQEIDNTTQENEISNDDIVMDDSTYVGDAEMPKPETKDYRQHIKLSSKFMELFYICTGDMKYATTLTNSSGGSIKLVDLVEYVESSKDSIPIDEMNIVISFLASAEFKYVRPIMSYIEKNKQAELWSLIEDSNDKTN